MGRVFWFAQRVVFCAAVLLMATGTCVRDMSAQDGLPIPATSAPHVGIPEDWSTPHVVYTRNGSLHDMMKVRDDPRFLNNVLLHYAREHGVQIGQPATTEWNIAGSDDARLNENTLIENALSERSHGDVMRVLSPILPRRWLPVPAPPPIPRTKVDWAVSLGATGGMAAGQSPAKYSFNYPNATPNCATDFAVYTIDADAKVGTQANLIGLNNLYVNGGTTGYCYTNSGTSYALTQVIVNTAQTLTLTSVAASVGTTAVYTFSTGGIVANAYEGFVFVVTGFTNLNNNGTFICAGNTTTTLTLINPYAVAVTGAGSAASSTGYTTYLSTSTAATWEGVNAVITGFTSAGNNITVTPGTLLVDPGYGFAVATTTQVSVTQAGTITFEYEAPTFLFSYAIQAAASALSPVLSLDGTKVAWTDNANPALLHVTTWKSGEGTNATTGSVGIDAETTPGNCTSTGESCDVTVNYTDTSTTGCTANLSINSNSNLYVDYPSDNGYVSANNGVLYQISGIFRGIPTLTFCTKFSTTTGTNIGSPVYDALNNTVYVSDGIKVYGYTVGATSFTATSPHASYTYANAGLSSTGPVLDAFGGFVYAFSNNDNQAGNKTSVTQILTTLASGVNVNLGPQFGAYAGVPLYYGAFDNNYYNYGAAYGSNPASTLYTCGTDSTKTYNQDLFAVSFNANTGVANTATVMSNNNNVNGGAADGTSQATAVTCSPLSEFYDQNTSSDRLFVGSGTVGAATGPNLVQMWNIDTQLTNTSGTGGTEPTYASEATGYLGGTSGITMDNISTDTGAESIYFGTESANSTAVARAGYNVNGIYTNTTMFPQHGGMDDDGNAYSSTELGTTLTWNGTTFTFGTANAVDAWGSTAGTVITLPAGSFTSLEILAVAVNGDQTAQTFTVTYTDNSTTTITQSLSDWYTGPPGYPGESVALTMAYENTYNGQERVHTTYVYGYTFSINSSKTVKSLTLPANRNVVVLAAALGSSCGANNYCAVKLTQSALQ